MDYARKIYKNNLKTKQPSKIGQNVNKTPVWLNKNIDIDEASDEERLAMEEFLKEFK